MLENISDRCLKSMTREELCGLCEKIRGEIIESVLKNGGHLSSNLGAVELTAALHYVFDFPEDKVIFDVGHQCYTHKILSGRADKFCGLRQKGGISGFPKREESKYDCYNTGHAGTSVSAALGIAKARDLKGEDFNVIAVIGDGSFNNGLVYEALNNLKSLKSRILIIINDNGMSISPTVGTMHEYLEALKADVTERYHRDRRAGIFERFGLDYDGVYDGNNIGEMIDVLTEVKEKLKKRSVILHVFTKKGKGDSVCEDDPEATHGIGNASEAKSVEYSKVLGEKLISLAERDERIVAVTAAMTKNVGLAEFFDKFPQRSVDVGICEEHAAIMCAAMATEGLKPYFAVYSTFLQRSFDEIVIDICSQRLPVTLLIDRAGISGCDGETHQGVFDLSYLSLIPSITIAVPKDSIEFENMLEFSLNFDAPLAIRYPRVSCSAFGAHSKVECGKWELLKKGDGKAVILACGERAISRAYAAIEKCGKSKDGIALVNARFVKPLDNEMLSNFTEDVIITVEDNMLCGGFGSLVTAFFAESCKRVKNFAYRDDFICHGEVEELMDEYGLAADDIAEFIKNEIR